METTHRGSLFTVEVHRWNDEQGRSVTREIVRHPGAVLAVPVLDDGRIVMVRNERIAVDRTLLELPAGKLEPDEAPIDAARREVEEETGYHAGRMTPLATYFTSPGFADELVHAFVAESLVHVGQRLEPGERIEVELVEPADAIEMTLRGAIVDAKTIAALLIWDRIRSESPR